MRTAVVHDWLTGFAGGERVLEQILACFPDADLFAVCDFLPAEQRQWLGEKLPQTTFIQNLPFARKRYRSFLPLMPLAIEQLDVTGYDLVISSSHAVAKGVLTGPDQLHVSYVHSPMRYAWDLQHVYLREAGVQRGIGSWLRRYVLHRLRQWDLRTANGVDLFVANSQFIARRIWKTYRRRSEVIHPPVDTGACTTAPGPKDYYFTASRMVPYKRIGLIVDAFREMPDRRLVVAGEGPEAERIRRRARNCTNIEFTGYLPTERLYAYMAGARAFVFAAEEDFGIMPVEAQACGTPVVAYGGGGVAESVVSGRTGVLYERQTPEAVIEAVREMENRGTIGEPEDLVAHARQFDQAVFRERLRSVVLERWGRRQQGEYDVDP